jgi:hypothetical protein
MDPVSTTPSLAARERELHFGGEPGTEAPSDTDLPVGRQSGTLERAYEGFLRLPVAMVVGGALWLFGMALLSAGALLLYLIAALLLQATG